jgi:hypothetical protein
LVLEERDHLASSGPPRQIDRRQSRIKGLSWIYEDLAGGTTVHLDGDLRYQELRPVLLRFTVRGVAPAHLTLKVRELMSREILGSILAKIAEPKEELCLAC